MNTDNELYNYKLLVYQLIEEGNYIKAASIYERIYNKQKDNVDLLYDIAMFQHEYINPRQALFYYDEIIAIEKSEAGAYYGKAIILEELDQIDDAIYHYKKAIEWDPGYHLAHLYLADIYDEQKKDTLAEEHIKKAIKYAPDEVLCFNHYGSFLESRNRDVEALEQTEKALEIESDHYLSLFNMGGVLMKKKGGEINEAILYYEKSVLSRPTYAYSYLNMAVLYKESGQYEKAFEILTSAILHNSDVSVLYYNRGIMLVGLDRFEQATKDVIKSIELSPSLKKYALIDTELKGIDLVKIKALNA